MAALAKINGLLAPCWTKAANISLTMLIFSAWMRLLELQVLVGSCGGGGQRLRQANRGRQPDRISPFQHSTSSQSELITFKRFQIQMVFV